MITGDNALTGISVARKSGIIHPNQIVFLGDIDENDPLKINWQDIDSEFTLGNYLNLTPTKNSDNINLEINNSESPLSPYRKKQFSPEKLRSPFVNMMDNNLKEANIEKSFDVENGDADELPLMGKKHVENSNRFIKMNRQESLDSDEMEYLDEDYEVNPQKFQKNVKLAKSGIRSIGLDYIPWKD